MYRQQKSQRRKPSITKFVDRKGVLSCCLKRESGQVPSVLRFSWVYIQQSA